MAEQSLEELERQRHPESRPHPASPGPRLFTADRGITAIIWASQTTLTHRPHDRPLTSPDREHGREALRG
ncbi:MAG TPA: hypothetical protein VHN16_08485 [Streptosporangiaceae bacterium]|nr:hypothetical protein [Streptosporangiaceae bacterium]